MGRFPGSSMMSDADHVRGAPHRVPFPGAREAFPGDFVPRARMYMTRRVVRNAFPLVRGAFPLLRMTRKARRPPRSPGNGTRGGDRMARRRGNVSFPTLRASRDGARGALSRLRMA